MRLAINNALLLSSFQIWPSTVRYIPLLLLNINYTMKHLYLLRGTELAANTEKISVEAGETAWWSDNLSSLATAQLAEVRTKPPNLPFGLHTCTLIQVH